MENQPLLPKVNPNEVERIQEYKAQLVESMPRSPYTIDSRRDI